MSISLGRRYKQCKKCGDYIPRFIYDSVSKKSIPNKIYVCTKCVNDEEEEKTGPTVWGGIFNIDVLKIK